jgi:hypothetical protein
MVLFPLLHGEVLLPQVVLTNREPREVEAILVQQGILPAETTFRWRMDPAGSGWIVEYAVVLPKELRR